MRDTSLIGEESPREADVPNIYCQYANGTRTDNIKWGIEYEKQR
ncbi:MAG TPA: hypothetical protein PLK41_08285 [Defluviitoga tunisiensis]|nr:hypothetical protein [Defluviitoga tunisiensis]